MGTATVLVVDDDAPTVQFLTNVLEGRGYQVRASADGQALQVARDEHPGVILLDMVMPGMDGMEVGRRLRADAHTAHIPIIAISGASDLPARATALGAVDYMTKPFAPAEVVRCVERWAPHGAAPAASTTARDAGARLEPRPSPQQARAWFSGDLSADDLIAYLATLRADPNWYVDDTPGPSTRTLRLVYFPNGERLDVRLKRVGHIWCRMSR